MSVFGRPGKLAAPPPPGTQHNTEEGAKVGQRQMPEWKLLGSLGAPAYLGEVEERGGSSASFCQSPCLSSGQGWSMALT